MTNVLEVVDLVVSVALPHGRRATVVDGVSFKIGSGETLGLVGESGCGKTMTGLAITGLLPPGAQVESGAILFEGEDLLDKSSREMRRLRGSGIAMVLQDALTALDPSYNIRSQLAAPLERHRSLKGPELEGALVSALEQVHLSASTERLKQYPHQLSGGMRQRVTSAIALAGRPRLLIADEPTTALDATTQVHYLALLRELQEESGFALLFVTHDLLIVRHVCKEMLVMYAGQIVEEGTVADVFTKPQHPYTSALLGTIPVVGESVMLTSIRGQPPDPGEVPHGCRFATRCELAQAVCSSTGPALTSRGPCHQARCWGSESEGWIRTL